MVDGRYGGPNSLRREISCSASTAKDRYFAIFVAQIADRAPSLVAGTLVASETTIWIEDGTSGGAITERGNLAAVDSVVCGNALGKSRDMQTNLYGWTY